MKKTRVEIRKEYYFINTSFGVSFDYDYGTEIEQSRFVNNNYFRTKEEAESMASKLRAVLDGVDVIEMPSEEEIKKGMSNLVCIIKGYPLEWYVNIGVNFITNFLKSKIIK